MAVRKAAPAPTVETASVYDHGARAYHLEHGEHGEPANIIWHLMEEAARTERAVVRAGPRLSTQHGVEYFHTRAEIWGTEVEMAIDDITYNPSIHPQPTSQEYGRFMVVFPWLRMIQSSKPMRARKIVWKLAHGVPAQALADQYGYGSRQGVLALKYRALANIAEGLRKVGVAC